MVTTRHSATFQREPATDGILSVEVPDANRAPSDNRRSRANKGDSSAAQPSSGSATRDDDGLSITDLGSALASRMPRASAKVKETTQNTGTAVRLRRSPRIAKLQAKKRINGVSGGGEEAGYRKRQRASLNKAK